MIAYLMKLFNPFNELIQLFNRHQAQSILILMTWVQTSIMNHWLNSISL